MMYKRKEKNNKVGISTYLYCVNNLESLMTPKSVMAFNINGIGGK